MNTDFVQLASALGLKGVIAGKEYRARCPLHDDTSPSFSMRIDNGVWICHRGCGSGDFHHLVELVLGCSIQEAYDWINNNGRAASVELLSKRLGELLNQDSSATYVPENLSWQHRYALLSNDAMPIWFMKRGFSWETIDIWGIKYDHTTDSVIIPVYWKDELVGTVTRHTRPNYPKYQNSPGLPRSEILFGRPLDGNKSVIIVEGLLDTIWLWQLGYNAISLLGNRISNIQLGLLWDYQYSEIILALDNDQGGLEGTEQVRNALVNSGRLATQVSIVTFPTGKKDPQDCSDELFQELLDNRKDYLQWSRNLAIR